MEKSEKVTPKAFTSYSWTTQEHQDWILDWATRLRADGVDVILDLWDLKKGHDKYAFMERMVTDPNVSKVIIFSDSEYAKKADARTGGVGTESQIISREVYERVAQEKFIPVVCEFDDKGPCLPTFLKSRIYLDFSTPDKANENYEQLLRAIFDRPLHQKPLIGRPPEYLFEESTIIPSSRPLLITFKNAILNDRGNYKGLAIRFLQDFFNKIEEFRIVPNNKAELDDLVVTSIEQFIPFRDDFVEFVTLVCSMRDDIALYDEIADFFERTLRFQYPPKDTTEWIDPAFDNFRFITYELFLYTIALLIKYKRFGLASVFLEKAYILPDNSVERHTSSLHKNYVAFDTDFDSFVTRKQRLKLDRISLEADFLKNRATLKEVSFQELMQADCVCFLKSVVFELTPHVWYPNTVVYSGHGRPLELFARAASHKDCEKLLSLINVTTKEDLIARYNAGAKKHGVDQWAFSPYRLRISFQNLFNFAHLGTV
jgi:TIR domain